MLGIILSIMTIGCSKKEGADSTTISPDEALINAKIDVANEEVSKIVEEQFDATYADAAMGRGGEQRPPNTCPTITRVPAFGQAPTVGQTVSKIIDFGASCIRNGNILGGKINISFVYDPSATTHTITYIFDDFKHNNKTFVGQRTITKTMAASAANSTVHPIVVMNMNMTMSLPDGRTFTRFGTRTRELISGSIANANAVYQVVGNWTTTFPNNSIQTSTITTPIIVKQACTPVNSPLSSGIITFVRNNNTATLNYGDGTCDKLAVFTYNGIAHNITLGN